MATGQAVILHILCSSKWFSDTTKDEKWAQTDVIYSRNAKYYAFLLYISAFYGNPEIYGSNLLLSTTILNLKNVVYISVLQFNDDAIKR